MDCTLQSGGLHLTDDRIKAAVDAGLQALGISIDGLKELHDKLRGVKGSFEAAFNALHFVKEVRHHCQCQYADYVAGHAAVAGVDGSLH